jgi:peptidoglycan/xylan/chitin deacetylase (PgdA/CDA1 family)
MLEMDKVLTQAILKVCSTILTLMTVVTLLGSPHLAKAASVMAPAAADAANSTGIGPNEIGRIPILEYHDIVKGQTLGTYAYPSTQFRADMEWLYEHHYRPINLSDYVNGWIDCPAGMSPVIITFDDAMEGQFRYLTDGKIDPDCAVGILETMNEEHPDWRSKATFFVLTNEAAPMPKPFSAPHEKGTPVQFRFAEQKMRYLLQAGFEIGNHTLHHSMHLKSMTPAQVEAEFAGGEQGIQKYLPGYNVQTLALPYGIFPKDLTTLKSGASGGVNYHNICAMAAGAGPAPSPISVAFQPYRIPRIIPGNNKVKPGGAMTIRYWLNQMELHPSQRFVSDGDPHTYSIPLKKKRFVNVAWLGTEHFVLRILTN